MPKAILYLGSPTGLADACSSAVLLVVLFVERNLAMRMRVQLAAAMAIVSAATTVIAAGELTSGIAVGEKVTTYSSTKCGGIDDGIAVGKSLCFT